MKKGTIFILILMLFAVKSFSQSFSNVDTINVVLSASSFKTVTLATGVKCITVDNSAQIVDLKIGFSPHGSTVDTSNTYTVPAGGIYSFPDRINNYLYLKNGATSTIRLVIDYGAGLPYYNQGKTEITNPGFYVVDTTKYATLGKANRDTVNGSPDTLSRLPGNFFITSVVDTADNMTELGVTKWYQLIIVPGDTIVLSTSVTFNDGNYWIIYPNESWTSEQFNKFYTGNYYWKTLFTGGHTGSAIVRWKYWGF